MGRRSFRLFLCEKLLPDEYLIIPNYFKRKSFTYIELKKGIDYVGGKNSQEKKASSCSRVQAHGTFETA